MWASLIYCLKTIKVTSISGIRIQFERPKIFNIGRNFNFFIEYNKAHAASIYNNEAIAASYRGDLKVNNELSLKDLIIQKFDTLTEGQKSVAKYLLERPEDSVFKTATQIGMEVGVSESTVIRLCYSLGINGFTHLQQLLREQFIKPNSTIYKFQESTESRSTEINNIFTNVLAKDIEIMKRMVNDVKEDDLWAIVDDIIQSDQVIVVGHRISYGPAYWFSFILNLMLGNVSMYPSTSDIIESIMGLTEKSVFVVVSFPRYTRESVRIAEIAREKGAKIVAVTDNHLSPVGRIAHRTITTEVNTSSGMDSITSISALLNLIIAGISNRKHKEIKGRLKLLENEYKRHQIFTDY
ncbi:N-acetylmannosamine kinase [Caldalkalibacillus thermarum]|nr:N-acetylmannosamine kinase [Caldalkalibacillus thermarum]